MSHLGDIVEKLLADATVAWLIGHWTFPASILPLI
jgi:hypothetical protein